MSIAPGRTALLLSLALAAAPALSAPATAPAPKGPSNEELARQLEEQRKQIEALAAQLEKSAQPVPAADKLHIGGYGEMHYNNWNNTLKDTEKREIDFHRFVLFFGYDFSPGVRFVSELELEHALAKDTDTSCSDADADGVVEPSECGKPATTKGEVEIEQAYLEFDVGSQTKAKAGLFLVPVGILNETHEPPTFYGVERNPVENAIIPTTWWEGGIGIGGAIAQTGLSYDLALHSGLKVPTTGGSAFLPRSGRQKVSEASAEDLAYTARLQYSGLPGLRVATSYQIQEDVSQAADTDKVGAELLEAHVIAEYGPFAARALWAKWELDGAAAEAAGRDEQDGYYGEAAYRVVPAFGFFSRYSAWDNGGTAADTEIRQVNTGFNFWPVANVVIKADVQAQSGADDNDGYNLGVGYHF